MRFIEALRSICNKFIRGNTKMEPESNQISPEPISFPKMPEEVQARWKIPEHEKKIRRYREFAYHHRKKRIRKKYKKKLLKISYVDRFVDLVNRDMIVPSIVWRGDGIIGVDYSSRKDFTPGDVGRRKGDHGDSRMNGGVR